MQIRAECLRETVSGVFHRLKWRLEWLRVCLITKDMKETNIYSVKHLWKLIKFLSDIKKGIPRL